MPLIDWNDDLALGIESIDKTNKTLVELTNNLHLAMSVGRATEALAIFIDDLTAYAETHLKYEESLLTQHGYPNKELHFAQHATLVRKVASIKQRIQNGERMLSMDVMLFLEKWIREHIQVSDRAFADYLKNQGIS